MSGLSRPFNGGTLALVLPTLSTAFYASTAAGIAASSNGQYFTVAGDGSTSYSKLYQNSGGSAVLVATYADSSQVVLKAGATLSAALTFTRTDGIDALIVSGTRTGADLFSHAYEDSTAFSSTTTGAYASYDTTVTMSGATAYNHFYGYEARHTFSGSGGVTTMSSFYSGLVVSGAANAVRHFSLGDAGGVAAITEQTGLYIPDLTRGTTNYGVYSAVSSGTNKWAIYAVGTAKSYFGGQVTFNAGQSWAGTIAVPSATQTINFATNTNLVIGGSGTIASVSSLNDAGNTYQPLGLNGSVLLPNCPIRLKSYTVATLPSASSSGAGATAFVTDANATTFASIVASGGANGVPVYSDGTNWRIG